MSKSKLAGISSIVKAGMETFLSDDGFSLSTANSTAKGKAFLKFYVQDIVAYLDNWSNFDENRFEDNFCDGSKDFGIDFVYEQPEDNKFWMCQSKYKASEASLTRDEIANFFQIHGRILDKSAFSDANQTVRDLLSGFTESSVATFVLLTNGVASEDNKREFQRLRKKAKNGEGGGFENFEWGLVDLVELEKHHQGVQLLDSKPPTIRMHMRPFGKDRGYIEINMPAPSGKTYKTIVIIAKGTELAELYRNHRHSLFNLNIRGFLGSHIVKNKKIKETLLNEPEFFYLYNNGISAICNNLDVVTKNGGYLVDCKDFQIINGAQTMSSIGEFDKEYKGLPLGQNLEKVGVLMRITQTEAVKNEQGLNKKVIVANNTQNIIKDADFHANDLVQISIKKQFQKFKYQVAAPYKPLEYVPKRIHQIKGKDKKLVVKMEDLAKALYAFHRDRPDKLNSQTKFLFDEEDSDGYKAIFGDPNKTISPDDGEMMAAVAMLSHYLTARLKGKMNEKNDKGEIVRPKDSVAGMAMRTSRHFLWAYGHIIRDLLKNEQKIYKRMVNGGAFKENGFVDIWFDNIAGIIERQLERDSDDGKVLNFKLWLRDNRKVKELQKEIDHVHVKWQGFKID